MASILSRPQCINQVGRTTSHGGVYWSRPTQCDACMILIYRDPTKRSKTYRCLSCLWLIFVLRLKQVIYIRPIPQVSQGPCHLPIKFEETVICLNPNHEVTIKLRRIATDVFPCIGNFLTVWLAEFPPQENECSIKFELQVKYREQNCPWAINL